jgi:hypothetical protein
MQCGVMYFERWQLGGKGPLGFEHPLARSRVLLHLSSSPPCGISQSSFLPRRTNNILKSKLSSHSSVNHCVRGCSLRQCLCLSSFHFWCTCQRFSTRQTTAALVQSSLVGPVYLAVRCSLLAVASSFTLPGSFCTPAPATCRCRRSPRRSTLSSSDTWIGRTEAD